MELCQNYHIWRLQQRSKAAYNTCNVIIITVYEISRNVNSRIIIFPTFLCIIETMLSIEDPTVGMVIQMAYGKKGVG